ncbi:MAG: class I SAM-dependent methyltransferase [Candidatus Liptonbacteria bacterium]|nr:class I SAM-dependent methyltransferase [Candidatus Liptonbacteria bacterium]
MSDFYERYWQNSGAGAFPDLDIKWEKLRKYLPKEACSVLDFGCGAGLVLKKIAGEMPKDTEFSGADVSSAGIAEAKKNFPEAKLFTITDGGALPIPDSSIDFIFTSEVIEHVYDTENAVREMARVLKPGGKMLLTTPFHGLLKNLALVLTNFDSHFSPTGPHIRFFTKKSLLGLLNKYGVKETEVDYFGRFYPFPHSIIVLGEKKQ